MAALFGEKQTLLIYSMMYGTRRAAPCPMCTSFLSAWNGIAVNLRQRVAIAVTARSPIERSLGLYMCRVPECAAFHNTASSKHAVRGLDARGIAGDNFFTVRAHA